MSECDVLFKCPSVDYSEGFCMSTLIIYSIYMQRIFSPAYNYQQFNLIRKINSNELVIVH